MNQPERITLYRGRFLELARIGTWEFAHRVRGSTPVGIVALTEEGKLILISQYRIPVGKICVEIPAGLVGDAHDESWQEAAKRELHEETGFSAEKMEFLSEGPTSAGLTSECIRLVRAHGVHRAGPPMPDGDEDITVYEVKLEESDAFLRQRMAEGMLIDPKVYAALYFAAR